MLCTLRDENPFIGDSSDVQQTQNFQIFLQNLQDLKDGKKLPFTIILNDPMASCFIQNPYHPEPDPLVIVEEYERTDQQNDDLGITGMVV